MSILIGADIVPSANNCDLFSRGEIAFLVKFIVNSYKKKNF